MRVWVTGAAGFVGGYVIEALRRDGHTPLPTDLATGVGPCVEDLDVCDPGAVDAAAARLRPDACIHLAGVAFVPDAARDPTRLRAINVEGARHVAEALLRHAPTARLVFASTAQVYGPKASSEPLRETDAQHPPSPYAESKAAAEACLLELRCRRGLDVVIARPGNHIGPRQSAKFVVPAFATALHACVEGRQDTLKVGNLWSERDFSDVRDVVDAYLLLLSRGRPGAVYNVSSGIHVRIGEVLEKLMRLAGTRPRVEVDPALYRPTDAFPRLDTSRLREETGWTPRHDFDTTLRDIWMATAATGCA